LSGSIAACARNGTSNSPTSVFEALSAAKSPAFFADLPGVFARSPNCLRSPSVESVALRPRSHCTSSASRPFFAAQKLLATTATPLGSSTTCVTPVRPFTLSALNEATFAPNTGGCATSAVCRFLRCTSRPNVALPFTFSAESRRRVGLPISLKSLAGLSCTFSGTGSFAAASASWP
jgi:hypothetical protein